MRTSSPDSLTHRRVLAIAVPIMLSNVTQPLIGVVDTAVLGQLPDAHYIGGIAVGALIFSFLYWGFGFLRMGTGGLVAQAFGAGDHDEVRAVFGRAVLIALAAGFLLIALSPFIERYAFALIEGSAAVEEQARLYFHIRIWAAPFTLVNFCLLGWFIGQSRARVAFYLQLLLNLTNMVLDVVFVLGLGMTADGVALGTLIAEAVAAFTGLWLVARTTGGLRPLFDKARILDAERLRRTITVNADIMVRTVCIIAAMAWFTARGARMGDVAVAANAVLLNLFEVAAYLIDGFAYAAEALVGQAIGGRDRTRYRAALRVSSLWAMVVGAVLSLLMLAIGPFAIDMMSVNPEVRAAARHYLPWAAATPILGAACFQLDGIFVGATRTADMRNMMILSFAAYLAAWWTLEPMWGNHGLWAALAVFFVARAITLGWRLPGIERQAFAG
ncbi:MAG: MATE family efflux transporter [Parvibaculaceae bacterium]